ncbi:helix-turn-helix domain-containing protein [Flavobacterium tegetincola]|uniref:helix-turn-helix domain-containing protein n=1 Tax=Flavobacterium tegetincola TaxID=150172 RepID=UPI0012FB934F
MLTFNLQPIFSARGIEKPFSFLVKNGFTPHSAHNIINSKSHTLRLDHVELLCELLFCEPNDLFLWTPSKNKVIHENNPLNKLRNTAESNPNLKTILDTLPYTKLKELSNQLNE